MNRRPQPLVRSVASGLLLVAAAALVGCGSDRRLYEEAATEAESGVATSLELTASQATALLAESSGASDISPDDIDGIFLLDARGYEADLVGPVKTRALFDLVEHDDGTVTFSVFLRDSVFRSSGLTTTSQTRHSCGELVGRFGEGVLSVNDLDCPAEFESAAGEDSQPLSMTENAAKYGVNVGSAP